MYQVAPNVHLPVTNVLTHLPANPALMDIIYRELVAYSVIHHVLNVQLQEILVVQHVQPLITLMVVFAQFVPHH